MPRIDEYENLNDDAELAADDCFVIDCLLSVVVACGISALALWWQFGSTLGYR